MTESNLLHSCLTVSLYGHAEDGVEEAGHDQEEARQEEGGALVVPPLGEEQESRHGSDCEGHAGEKQNLQPGSNKW